MRGLVLIFILFGLTTFSQTKIPYKVGEYSAFHISFGGIKVGSAELEIERQINIDGISTFHIVGKGKTAVFFDWFFKVRDVYETYLDTSKIRPVKFFRDISEGGYKKKQQYNFKHIDDLVFWKDTSSVIFSNTQDMLSALFYARTFKKDSLNQKKSFFVPVFMDEENYLLEILYLRNEKVKTNFGTINCMLFKPKMQEGRVFQDGEQMKIWISDDENRLLIKVETQIWAGSIKAILVKHQKVKHPLSIIK
ncbi:MAG: hypothetical protein CMD19_05475 [Flavobacteriales bacterium]|nr:hypothetical protein [Flavobacteriales bacterium]|tara:strand:- start:65011 stop:65760 length:750 start_codon:yes stop_codon:yes gene_type:complete